MSLLLFWTNSKDSDDGEIDRDFAKRGTHEEMKQDKKQEKKTLSLWDKIKKYLSRRL